MDEQYDTNDLDEVSAFRFVFDKMMNDEWDGHARLTPNELRSQNDDIP